MPQIKVQIKIKILIWVQCKQKVTLMRYQIGLAK